jgi:hypothetical protein
VNLYFLRDMKAFGKVGVSVVSLVLLATPIMACVMPAAAMTAAERDCCKRMAQECGKNGMAKSHSCCQTATVPDHLNAIKSSSDDGSRHLALSLVHAVLPSPTLIMITESGFSVREADIHSPPVSPPANISILRI